MNKGRSILLAYAGVAMAFALGGCSTQEIGSLFGSAAGSEIDSEMSTAAGSEFRFETDTEEETEPAPVDRIPARAVAGSGKAA